MVRNYIRKTPAVDKNNLKKAIAAVRSGKFTMRKAAKTFNVGRSTLSRHCQLADDGVIKLLKRGQVPVFDEDQENAFFDYISKTSNVHSGLSSKEIRKLAYEYAKSLNLSMPFAWMEKESAGKDWFSNFLKRHNNLIRKTQEASLSLNDEINLDQLLQSVRTIKSQKDAEKNAISTDEDNDDEEDVDDDDGDGDDNDDEDDDCLLEPMKICVTKFEC